MKTNSPQDRTEWNLLKEKHPEELPNLEGGYFCHADFSGYDFSGINLREAEFRDSSLRGANLKSADLSF